MKAVVVYGNGEVNRVDLPMPEIGDYECLIQMKACGICNSTDLKIIKNKINFLSITYPAILGHENVGEVVAVGDKVKYIKVGDRFVNPLTKLPQDSPFHSAFGGFMEYGFVQDRKAMFEMGLADSPLELGACRQIPSDFDYTDAGMLLTLKETYSCLDNFGFRPGMEVLVYGDGPVGLSIAKFLRLEGASYIASVGHHHDRLEIIRTRAAIDLAINSHETDVNAAVGGRRFDLVIDAVGSTSIIKEGVNLLKRGGKLGVYGVLDQNDGMLNLFDIPSHTNIHMLMLPYGEHNYHDKVMEMIAKGDINPKDYYSHVMPVEEIEQAVQMTADRSALKVIVTF
ncbi:zinc-dependent alcohol dehydrogenase [Paenibacillus mendelii]|uniref:Zinc-binding dehydrogenase n=1 Tax=Paenibacillus mendelii TaxID=206163 RepID=A0ABV6JF65_9BACL|nr:alcohol dehydrogenase catalytic domain-containing protein [Paenibacillus mendelii]MCQ6557435.1 alcohol dehydrogenase catalytic domain-containing protein [Paenibacillus mendelii]